MKTRMFLSSSIWEWAGQMWRGKELEFSSERTFSSIVPALAHTVCSPHNSQSAPFQIWVWSCYTFVQNALAVPSSSEQNPKSLQSSTDPYLDLFLWPASIPRPWQSCCPLKTSTGWGRSRVRVVGTRSTECILILLFINHVVFSICTTMTYICPTLYKNTLLSVQNSPMASKFLWSKSQNLTGQTSIKSCLFEPLRIISSAPCFIIFSPAELVTQKCTIHSLVYMLFGDLLILTCKL